MRRGRAGHIALVVSPALIIVAVVLASLALGPRNVVLGLLVTAPLLAATFVGPRATAAYAVVAFVLAVVLGIYDEQYVAGRTLEAQLVRLTTVLIGGAVGVAASHYRLSRERRLSDVTRVAEAAQRAILLPVPERLGPVQLAVRYDSAASEALVGGDLYGVVVSPFGLRILVGDVRGKGLDAVRLSAQVLAAFRERASDHADLAEVMHALDRAVRRAAHDEDFVTAVLAQVTADGVLTLAVAGHPAPMLVRDGRATPLAPPQPCPPLVLDGGCVAFETPLQTGDRVLLYTDGLTEARRPGDRAFFPPELIADNASRGDVAEALDALQRALMTWSGGTLGDDVALVLVELAPPPEPAAAPEEGDGPGPSP